MRRAFSIYVRSCVLLIISGAAAHAGDAFPLSISVTQYWIDSTHTRVEIAYAIADTHLVFIPTTEPAILRAELELRIAVRSATRADSLRVVLESLKPTTQQQPSLLIGKRAFILPPDQYTVDIDIRDALRQRSAVLHRQFPLVVRAFTQQGLCASSIELAQWIARADTFDQRQVNAAFIKNGLYVVPLPSAVYEGTSPMLYAYLELYNLDQCRCDSVDLRYHILDAALNEVFDLRFRRPVVGHGQAEVVSVALDGLASGAYYLSVGVERPDKTELTVARQQFYIVNPELPPEQPRLLSEDELFLQSPFSTMDEQQLATEIASARLVARSAELESYEQLTSLVSRRRYLFRFWLQRDPDPSTPINERYEEFRKAREYAAKNYRTSRYPEGWNSDRGRVLLKYGFPSQIDRAYFNMDGAHPHEIWRYDNVQGGVIFVFVDQQGTENFVLVHSTALNEIRNENWYRQFAMPNYLDPNAPIR